MKRFKKYIFIGGFVAFLSSCAPAIVGIAKSINNTNNGHIVNPNEVKDVEITFEENGGTIDGLKCINTKSNVKFKDIPNIPKASREGVSGQPGWYYTNANDEKVVVTDETTFSESKVTLFANWKLYTVRFNSGVGYFPDHSQEKTFDNVTIVHSDKVNAPTCEGKTFTGWKVNDEKITFPYSPSGDNKEITVNATYEDVKTVEVVLLSNDGEFTGSKQLIVNVPFNNTYAEVKSSGLFSSPTYNGDKLFSTWLHNGAGISDEFVFNKPVLLTAYYTNAVSITFDVATNGGTWADTNGGEIRKTKKFKLTSSPKFSDFKKEVFTSNPKKGDIELLGWFDNKDADGAEILDSTIIDKSTSFTVYAYYKDPYQVNVSGSNYDLVSKPDKFCRKDKVTVKVKQKTGYTLTENIVVSWNGQVKTLNQDYKFTIVDGEGTLEIEDAKASNITVSVELSATVYSINNTGSYTGVSSINVGTSAAYNTSVSVSATPSTGYKVDYIYVKDSTGSTTLVTITGASGTFSMPAQNVKIVPSASKISYTITKSVVSGSGSLSVVSTSTYGSTVSVSASVNTGYLLSSIVIKNNSTGSTIKTLSSSSGTFSMPAASVTVTLNTTHPTYTVSLTNGTGVSSSSSSTSSCYAGTTVTITASANTGYSLTNIKYTEGSTTKTINFSSGKASFTMPYQNVSITVNATKNNYKITALNKHNGVSSLSCDYAVNTNIAYQATVTITASATSGFKLNKITYTNGSSTSTVTFGSNTSVTFKMPANNTTVEAYSDISDGYTRLASSSSSKTVLSAGKYWANTSGTFTNYNDAKGNGLVIDGAVELYIASGVTITCYGTAGSGKTGGGAGVFLRSGAKLTLTGSGKLVAVGGAGTSGSSGSNGSNGKVTISGDGTMTGGAGGKGGNGGGGGGAGIGGDGGNGGSGGAGASTGATVGCFDSKSYRAVSGSAGGNGDSTTVQGTLVKNNVTVSATAGAAGTAGGSGGSKGNYAKDTDSGFSHDYTGGGGGGGGGGGAGGAGATIGAGGFGGGGGGGGASGGAVGHDGYRYDGGGGGKAGTGAVNGSAGTDAYFSYSGKSQIAGGNGGSKGTRGS